MAARLSGKPLTAFWERSRKSTTWIIELNLHACAKCGNCMAECPAYLVTGNEAVTAKGKIALAKKLLAGQKVTQRRSNHRVYVHALQRLRGNLPD